MKIYKRRRNATAGGNGNKTPAVMGNENAPNFTEYYEQMFSSVPHRSVVEDFLTPGKDFATMIFRSVIPDDRLGNAILRLHQRHIKFKDYRHDEMLQQRLCMLVAKQGRSRLEALFAAISMLSPEMFQWVAGGKVNPKKEPRVFVNEGKYALPRQEIGENENQ